MTKVGYYVLLCCCSPLLVILLLAFLFAYFFWGILLSPIWLIILLVILPYFGYKWARENHFNKEMKFPTGFSEETKEQVALWGVIIQNKHKDDDEEIFCNDPLLIIEYNQPGLVSRNITENDVANVIRGTQNYIPIAFPKAYLRQSNSVFAFNSMQTIDEAIRDLYDNYHNTVIGRQDPIVGRVYLVEFRRANSFEVSEKYHIFD